MMEIKNNLEEIMSQTSILTKTLSDAFLDASARKHQFPN
jgi:hypothetical protein